MEAGKIFQEILIEDSESAQIIHIFLTEVQLFDIFYQLFNTAHDRITAAKGIVPEECVEDHGIVLFLILKVSLHHGQFIEICEQC